MMLLAHLPPLLAVLFASLVEFSQALTVVLAVGRVRGWQPAFTGAFAAILLLGVLLVVVVALGALLAMVRLFEVQLLAGVALLAVGLRWLVKAVRRAAGGLALRDETVVFMGVVERLRGGPSGIGAAFRSVMAEGSGIVVIVLAIGAGAPALLLPALAGSALALGLVMLAGLALHRPLAGLPENELKFGAAVFLTAFGGIWIGQACGLVAADDEVSLLILAGLVFCSAVAVVLVLREREVRARRSAPVLSAYAPNEAGEAGVV